MRHKGCFLFTLIVSLSFNIIFFAIFIMAGANSHNEGGYDLYVEGTKEDLRDTLIHQGYSEESIEKIMQDCIQITDSRGETHTYY